MTFTIEHARPVEERLWERVEKDGHDGCWVWTGACSMAGYGQIGNGKVVYTHRLVYELLVGAIPEGLCLDHLCRNRACCNPEHLEPVTGAENSRRGLLAQKTHCPKGHPYAGANLYTPPGSRERRCRACARARDAGRRR